MQIIKKRLELAFRLTEDLVQALPDKGLQLRLRELPSNSIGEQIWCIIGARESYFKAVVNKGWVGFTCSLDDLSSKDKVIGLLESTKTELISYLRETRLTDVQIELVLTLLEHEVQHHGQLIRYFYANKLAFPPSWNRRYTV